ncbi:exodeoxyribonuclease VII large subunit [Baekduia soli]|uniref:Exodeoxyribonuclease 7 large subunit n=1 Tax=Baekduia soli TaxID=496014 RepID=A0A5B8UAN6_9ACTN|nr:exodeoxyribonuclease VII large subunit [Baekduia soli]QEC50044.1 exodeoxyribonuclease VII large subunit [Baekduia soli]
MSAQPRPEGIEGSRLAGPFPVGAYAEKLREELRKRARVQLFGEVWNLRVSKAKVYFELRDGDGAVPCAMWRDAFERLGLAPGILSDGSQVVVAGGPDYYPGSRTSSPSFSFDVTGLRIAGEGDLLAQLEALRRTLAAQGLFEPQKALARPALPRCIGVVTGEGGKARDDVLAGLRRRGWAGRLVWAFAPVQDRHAAPRITRALQDLAAVEEVEVIVVARGGGSLADLFAFCDETLCRTVAMIRVPVIASVGHHTDRTLIDDVAAVSCSTPTHAAESAVPCHPLEARTSLARCAASLEAHGRRAVVGRARHLAALSRAPAQAIERHRTALHQRLRELRASARRRIAEDRERVARRGVVLARKTAAAAGPETQARRAALDGLASALAAHDPERTVARGYAIVDDGAGGVVTSAAQAGRLRDVRLFFGDGRADAEIKDIVIHEDPEEGA